MYSIKLGCEHIYYGIDSIDTLKELKGERKKAFIVMSGTVLKDNGMLDKVTKPLEEAGFQWEIYTEVEPEPSFITINKGAEVMKAFRPDWVIGFGGGSAMDAAKAMWVFYENPDYKTLDDVMPPNIIKSLKVKAKVACIPTSAGTGSEATRAALIKDTVLKRKYSIRDMNGRMVPDIAILDPVFTVTMPKKLTAESGMDALTHAIESYVTPLHNPFSDAMAAASFINGYQSLPIVYKEGNNLEARGKTLAAACMGGIAFSNCALGIVHSIAHAFGAEFGVSHGLANAVILPYGIAFNERDEKTSRRYKELAGYVGIDSLLKGITELRKELEIPSCMREVVKDEEQFVLRLNQLTKKAMDDVCTPFTPVKPEFEEMKELIQKVYYGWVK